MNQENTEFKNTELTDDISEFNLTDDDIKIVKETDTIKEKLSYLFDDVLDSTIYTSKRTKVPEIKSTEIFSKNITEPLIIKVKDFIPQTINKNDYILIKPLSKKELENKNIDDAFSINYVTLIEEGNNTFINRIFDDVLKKLKKYNIQMLSNVITESSHNTDVITESSHNTDNYPNKATKTFERLLDDMTDLEQQRLFDLLKNKYSK